jgi:lipopolysaccharide biosynthesis protein
MSNDVRLICFYLPQYHPIPENDRWWGKGFTDWKNVAMAQPYFPDHYQPHIPADLGFYDLRVPETREAQAAMAFDYGIYGFCYYYYWFNGHKLLERPFTEVLRSGKPDFPFCICWANENWTRRWDGREHEVLLGQRYSDQDDVNFIQSLLPAFRDQRYIRVNGRPLLIVYRTDQLPNPARTAEIWRDQMKAAGLENPYLCRAETFIIDFNYTDPPSIGFDAALEFPPHAILSDRLNASIITPGSDFEGIVFDYEQVLANALKRPDPSYKLFRGVMPGWDNTARRGNKAWIFFDSSPDLYEQWLAYCIGKTKQLHAGDERMVFINAWNEWAEGCHLEPDIKYGHRYLEATRNAVQKSESLAKIYAGRSASVNSQNDPEMTAIESGEYVSDILRQIVEIKPRLRKQQQVETKFQKLVRKLAEVERQLAEKNRKLDLIRSSLGWQLLTRCARTADRLLPDHTRRRRVFDSILKRLKTFLS